MILSRVPSARVRSARVLALLLALTLVASLPSTAIATPTASTIKLTLITSAVQQPVLVASPPDGTNRLFIVEKTGRIRILKNGTLLATPFLDLSASVSRGSEQGLLGLAFHPGFKTNRRYFVDYTDLSGNTVVREFKASATSPDTTAAGSSRTILRITQPYANHNGGMLAFGRDKYLYIGTGDGGSGGDPGNRAQSLNSLLGKMLRINVNGSTSTRNYLIPASNPYVGKTGRDEIWERGLRNPWRFSFDRSNGNLWIGDVGQNKYEEVDRAVRTINGPGKAANWGWRVLEGFHCYNPSTGCNKTGKRPPLLEYSHASNGRCAVTGGFVYRGTKLPALYAWYVFGDYCSGEVWAVASAAASSATPVLLLAAGSGRLISSFGEDAAGELYICDLGGRIYRIDPA